MSYNPPTSAAKVDAPADPNAPMSTATKVGIAAGIGAAVIGAVAVGTAVVGGGSYMVYQTAASHSQNKQPNKVHILLMSGTSLKASDSGNTSDPYVEITTGKVTVKSKTQDNTLNPQWNQEFHYGVHEEQLADDKVKFVVMDKDRFGKDDNLGTAVVQLSQLSNTPKDFNLKLERVDTGTLNVRLWLSKEVEE